MKRVINIAKEVILQQTKGVKNSRFSEKVMKQVAFSSSYS